MINPSSNPNTGQLQSVVAAINELKATPLSAIAGELERTVEPILLADEKKWQVQGPVHQLTAYIKRLVNRLPNSFKDRFYLDAALLKTLAREWNPSLELDRVLIPGYDSDWGYVSLPLPPSRRDQAYVAHLFLFAGDDNLEDVDLLEYPFIVHELAHYLLYIKPDHFPEKFAPQVDGFTASLKIRSVADRGAARRLADNYIEELKRHWNPTIDQRNWAHEIAMDTIGVWTCGPAYIAAFLNMLHKREPDLSVIEKHYPPYITRVEALIESAARIGFRRHIRRLEETKELFWRTASDARSGNRLLRLAPSELVSACVQAALDTAKILGLRQTCKSEDAIRASEKPKLGFELLHTAWQISERDPSRYKQWERSVVRALVDSFTQ